MSTTNSEAPQRTRAKSQGKRDPWAPVVGSGAQSGPRTRSRSTTGTTDTRVDSAVAPTAPRTRAKSAAAGARSATKVARASASKPATATGLKAKALQPRRVKSSTAVNGHVRGAATPEPSSTLVGTPETPHPQVTRKLDPITPAQGATAPHSDPLITESQKRRIVGSSTQSGTTPLKMNSHSTHPDGLSEQRKILMDELGSIPCVGSDFLKTLYTDLKEDKIDEFLAASPNWNSKSKRWKSIPSSAALKNEKKLYGPLVALIAEIIEVLGEVGDAREVVQSDSIHLYHIDNPAHFTEPDISIKASGPSFCLPSSKPKAKNTTLGYTNVASVFDAKKDVAKKDLLSHIEQLAVYARQIFIQQPNRIFVRSLLITERHFCMLHYDRSGAYYTDYLDIHKDIYAFVRLIVGLSSVHEDVLGLDTSIQWKVVDGKKVSGTITTVDENSNPITYNLNMKEPPFVRLTVCGRGTICWNANGKDGGRVVVKDAWRSEERRPETDYLALAEGARGVVQILSKEDNRKETKNYRPANPKVALPHLNRILLRVTLKAYGPPIAYFDTELQVLLALRDAIRAHKILLSRGVLHRDISLYNILLNVTDDADDTQSYIIDLDMAIIVEDGRTLATARTGTRMYQSVVVLKSYQEVKLGQDYLDDLESFFYVLCHIVFGFNKPGEMLPSSDRPEFLNEWESSKPKFAAKSKTNFYMLGTEGAKPSSFWSPPTVALINRLRLYLSPIIVQKSAACDMEDPQDRKEAIEPLLNRVDDHYTAFIDAFDKAIKLLSPPVAPAVRGQKRELEDVLQKEVDGGAKRSKVAVDDSAEA